MKAAEIREKTVEELNEAIADNRTEAFNLRMQQQTGQLENTARMREIRRDIARMLTVLNSKNAEKGAGK